MSELDLRVAYTVRLNGKGKGSLEYLAPMSAGDLIASLAGELLVDPALLLEMVREDQDALRAIRSYGAGDFTYEQVLDTLKELV
jgi:hypothetical protein